MRYATNAYCICGNAIDHQVCGRQRRYCSDACRKAAQRYRENAEKSVQEASARQEIRKRCHGLPVGVHQKLEEIERFYGVWAAYEASELLAFVLE